ncbi:MAG: folate-binding protein [Solirubrobacterales bacterium]|nr:folate-binding protein [Solirubrobacterales bacterium]
MATFTSTSATAYSAVTTGCGVLDRSESGKLALGGDQAREFLSGQVSNDTEALEPGTGCYAALLDNKGKMHGDLRVIHTPDRAELLLLCERVALQALFDALRRSIIGWRAELHKRTVQQALLSLVGPASRSVADANDLPEQEHANALATLGGHDVLLVATDLGVDVICDADAGDAVLAELLQRGAVAIDEATAELRRIEAGRPRYGVDLDTSVIPQEAGLNDRAVSFTKGCYVGQETVARLYYRGKPNRHLRGLRLDAPVAAGAELHGPPKADGSPSRVLGTVTSTALSPVHGPIALAIVRREAEVGDTVTVGQDTTASVVELPFDRA